MAPSTDSESEALSMFFNDDFIPHTYLDALFDSTLKTATGSNLRSKLDSPSTIQQLQTKCSSLLAHLDYYTKELTTDLEDRIKTLQNSSNIIMLEDFEVGNNDSDQDASHQLTRLDYYIENLSNSITSLYEDVDVYNKRIKELQISEQDQEVLNKLTDLKKIKQRMLLVLKIFETAKLVATTSQLEDDDNDTNLIAPTSNKQVNNLNKIDLDSFTKSLYLLEGAIDEELQIKNVLGDLINKKINNLINLLPLFQGLPRFYNVYSLFVGRIQKKLV